MERRARAAVLGIALVLVAGCAGDHPGVRALASASGGPGGPAAAMVPGAPPVVKNVATTDPVVFVTIDDGWTKDPAVVGFLADHHVRVSAFVIGALARMDPGFWHALVAQGAVVEDHTATHPPLAGRSLDAQQIEICAPLDDEQRLFGRRPTLFRPPYGSMDATTVEATKRCGLAAVVLWDATVERGRLRRATPGPLQAGDIVLLHWGPGLVADLQELVGILDHAGLHSALLEDYLRPPASAASP